VNDCVPRGRPESGKLPPVPEVQFVQEGAQLAGVVAALSDVPLYGLDTEFQGERTYHPRLALVQIAWPGGLAILDPMAVDVAPLAPVLAGPGTLIAHAGDQDLTILERACGVRPAHLFDTQIAAGFLGYGTPSLATLCERILGVRLAKGDRLTDWTRRPLTADQRAYAASDVEHLTPLYDDLVARLTEEGRLEWALDECEERRLRAHGRPDPATAWWRIKGSRQLRGKARGVAQEVAAWREREAERADLPPRFVLPDLALASIVQRAPHSREDLAAVRGLDGRHMRDGTATAILAAVQTGLALTTDELRLPETDASDRTLAPAVTVIGAWLTQRAAELDLEPSLLATRADLTALISTGGGRLATGWRLELVGEPIRRLLAGEAAIALEDGGRRIALSEG
jgi:ribonuclease D